MAVKLARDPGECGQDVVGLETLDTQGRDAQDFDHAADRGDLGHEFGVHLGPLDFVLVVHRVAKGLARHVEGAKQIVGFFFLHQKDQIPGKSEHGPHRFAPGLLISGKAWNT